MMEGCVEESRSEGGVIGNRGMSRALEHTVTRLAMVMMRYQWGGMIKP